MQLIKHNNPKYGFFVGYRGLNPVWQPDKIRARFSFKSYLDTRPHTTVENEFEKLKKLERYNGCISIIQMW